MKAVILALLILCALASLRCSSVDEAPSHSLRVTPMHVPTADPIEVGAGDKERCDSLCWRRGWPTGCSLCCEWTCMCAARLDSLPPYGPEVKTSNSCAIAEHECADWPPSKCGGGPSFRARPDQTPRM